MAGARTMHRVLIRVVTPPPAVIASRGRTELDELNGAGQQGHRLIQWAPKTIGFGNHVAEMCPKPNVCG